MIVCMSLTKINLDTVFIQMEAYMNTVMHPEILFILSGTEPCLSECMTNMVMMFVCRTIMEC